MGNIWPMALFWFLTFWLYEASYKIYHFWTDPKSPFIIILCNWKTQWLYWFFLSYYLHILIFGLKIYFGTVHLELCLLSPISFVGREGFEKHKKKWNLPLGGRGGGGSVNFSLRKIYAKNNQKSPKKHFKTSLFFF